MKKINKQLFLGLIFLILGLIITAMFLISFEQQKIKEEKNSSLINLEWYYKIDDKKEYISVPETIDGKANEETTIYAVLPNDCGSIDTLFFRSVYQNVIIKVDDEIIYTYNTDDIRKFGLANPKKLNIVTLPNDLEGKELSITIKCPYDKYSGYFSDIQIGHSVDVVRLVYDKYQAGYIFSWVLIFIVLSLIIVNFVLFTFKMNINNMLYLLFSGLFLGIWLLGNSKLITFHLDGFVVHQITYISLMLCIFLIAIYIKQISLDRYKVLSTIIVEIALLNILMQIILYLKKVSDYVIFFPINILLMILLFVNYGLNFYEKMKSTSEMNKKMTFRYTAELTLVLALVFTLAYNSIISVSSNTNINNAIGVIYILLIFVVFGESIIKLIKKALEAKVYKERFKEAQNYLIQSQMKPHFIFNTLGAIRTLIMSSPKTAYEMTTNFSKYLRANINNIGPGEKITFAQELDHIKAYLAIETERFKDRVFVEYDIQCTDFLIPPLSIEPLVENAVKHGVCKRVKGGTVKISSIEYEDRYEVVVEDNGVGFDVNIIDSEAKQDSVGLKYIIIRLKELADADFKIESKKGKGTKATVTINKNITN